MTVGGWLVSLTLLLVSLPAEQAAPVSTERQKGERLYLQRCALCHSGTAPLYETYGPTLDRQLITNKGDEQVRKTIKEGSTRMPGFRYGLNDEQITNIIEYLKTRDTSRQ